MCVYHCFFLDFRDNPECRKDGMGCQQQQSKNRTRPYHFGNIYGLFRCRVPWMRSRIEATAWSFKKKGNLEEISNLVPNYLLMGKPDYQKYTTSSSLCPSNLEEFQEYKKNYAANKSVFGYYREYMSCVFEICFLRIQIHQ